MTPQMLPHIRKPSPSFKRIGRIRNTQIRVALVGEQPRQVAFQAVVHCVQALVRVARATYSFVLTAFV